MARDAPHPARPSLPSDNGPPPPFADAAHELAMGLTDVRPSRPGVDGGVEVLPIENVLERPPDVDVVTIWRAAVRLFHVPAERHVLWVDGIGCERLGSWHAERVAATLADGLTVDSLCTAPWVEAVLVERHPEGRRPIPRPGVDRALFAGHGVPDDSRLRVLIDDRWVPEPNQVPGRAPAHGHADGCAVPRGRCCAR